MILYRPVGLQELELIYDSGMKAFPARPEQPLFYPVLDLEYARQTASSFNAQSGHMAGYVTQFKVEDDYIDQFEKHTVGGSQHQELWIPAEDMEEFNRHITGSIKVIEAYFGGKFEGHIPDQFGLQGKNAIAQFTLLANSFVYKRLEFLQEIKRNHKAVFLNYPFWLTHEFKNEGLKEKVLQGIKEAWFASFPKNPLPNPVLQERTANEQSDPRLMKSSVSREADPVKPDESFSWEEDEPDDLAPVKQSNAPSFVKPVREEPKAEEQVKSTKLVKPVPEVEPPPDVASSQLQEKPVPQEVKPPEPHFMQGIKLGLQEQYREAITELSKAVAEYPRQVSARTSLGVAYHRVGEDDRALSCYEAALKIDPRYADAQYFKANILYKRGEVRDAMTAFTTAIGLNPELIGAHIEPPPQDRLTDYTDLPAGINRIARPARRILELNKLMETNPGDISLLKERAAEYTRLGNTQQAIADYTAALKIQPRDARMLQLRGQAYEKIGQTDRAKEDFQRAIAYDSQLSDAHLSRGVALGQMGNYRQSIVSLTEGIQLSPQNPNGYFNRGTSYFQVGELESAIADFSRVIQLAPKDEDAYFWRGISYEQTGNKEKAVADYKQFLAISQNPQGREEVEQRLRQWEEEKLKQESRSSAPEKAPKQAQTEPEAQGQTLDLYEIVAALGSRALHSTWFGSNVDCYGERADELYQFTKQDQPINGRDFIQITSGIQQTIKGDFQAFDRGANEPWLFVRAWDGQGFYVETNDPKAKARLMSQFLSIEAVEDTATPYLGLFIQI